MRMDAGMLRYRLTLKDYIRVAYRVNEFQVQGPDWIARAMFDVNAKLPAGASRGQVPEMLQSLLADRFQLKLRRETKEQSVYALVADKKGANLKPLPQGANGTYKVNMQADGVHLTASATLATLAERIGHFTDRPVVDGTGIEGFCIFDLLFSGRPSAEGPGSIEEALQKYGLSLQPRKSPTEFLIVDSAAKAPSDN